jgi:hypothetical protein
MMKGAEETEKITQVQAGRLQKKLVSELGMFSNRGKTLGKSRKFTSALKWSLWLS